MTTTGDLPKPTVLEVSEILTQRLDFELLSYIAVLGIQGKARDETIMANDRVLNMRASAGYLALAFTGHALRQNTQRNTAIDEELGWVLPVAERAERLSYQIKPLKWLTQNRDFSPVNSTEQRETFHHVLSRQRTVKGKKVTNPYGMEYAADVALDNIILPLDVAVVSVQDIEQLAIDHPLKQQLVQHLTGRPES